MVQFNQLDLGQILGNVESAKSNYLQNQLGQQNLQANEMMMQKEAQFNPLLQNYLANPSKENAQALFAADPQRGMEAVQQQRQFSQSQALETYTIARAVGNAKDPLSLLKNGYPGAFDEFSTELMNMGRDINKMSAEEIKQMAKSIEMEAGTMAGIDVQSENLKMAQAEADLQSTRMSTRKTAQDITIAREQAEQAKLTAKTKMKEATTEQEKEFAKMDFAIAEVDESIALVDTLLSHKGLKAGVGIPDVGIPGTSLRVPIAGVNWVPATAGADFRAKAKSLKAKLRFSELQKLRQAAPSGASGLGQLSDKEGEALEQAVQNLDTIQSEEQYISNLNSINEHLTNMKMFIELNKKIAGGETVSVPTSGNDLSNLSDEEIEDRIKKLKGAQ